MKKRNIRLGFSPEKGSRSFGFKMVEIDEFEYIAAKYQKKNGIKNNYLSRLPNIKQEVKQSKLITNKTLYVLNYFDLDVLDLREKVDHDGSFMICELNEKQVSGFLPSTNVHKSSSNFNSFLSSWDSSCNSFKYKNYDNIYYKCKCLLPFQIPVTDILISVGVVPYRDDIIFS